MIDDRSAGDFIAGLFITLGGAYHSPGPPTHLVQAVRAWRADCGADHSLLMITASVLNALGLNITKLDFQRQELLPPSARKPDWMRPYWLLGLALYIASQVIGSTLALNFLRAGKSQSACGSALSIARPCCVGPERAPLGFAPLIALSSLQSTSLRSGQLHSSSTSSSGTSSSEPLSPGWTSPEPSSSFSA